MSDQDFTGKVVIITGSSAGIGEASAILFASRGASVTLCGRDAQNLAAARQKCQEASPTEAKAQFHTVQGDVRDDSVLERIVSETVSELGRIDVLVANAALNVGAGTLEGTTAEDYDAIMDVGVKSVFFLIQKTVPHLEKTQGNVVVISSPVADRVFPGFMLYNISKAAIDHMVHNIAVELTVKGIRVNSVKPGVIPTNFFRFLGDDEALKQSLLSKAASKIPMGRTGTPEEVAKCVIFVASQAASYVTGSSLTVDGGITHIPITF